MVSDIKSLFMRLFSVSLNPTLIWIWSLTHVPADFMEIINQCLNPTLIWIWSLTGVFDTEKEAQDRLNPTLIWIWSLTFPKKTVDTTNFLS